MLLLKNTWQNTPQYCTSATEQLNSSNELMFVFPSTDVKYGLSYCIDTTYHYQFLNIGRKAWR